MRAKIEGKEEEEEDNCFIHREFGTEDEHNGALGMLGCEW